MKGSGRFGVAAVALVVAALTQYQTLRTITEIDQRIGRTNAVVAEMEAELAAIREVESASRGYAATGDERFIEQVKAGSAEARKRLAALRQITQSNPRQQQILERLEANVRRMLESADEVVGAKRYQGSSAAGEAIRESVRLKLMIETLNLIDWVKDEENSLLEAQVAQGRRATRWAGISSGLLTLVALGVIGMGVMSIRGRTKAEEALRKEQEFNAVALESLHDGIVTCNAEGAVTRLNGAALAMGAKAEDVPLERVLNGERVRNLQMTMGSQAVVASGQPVFSSTGEKLGAIIALHDITEIKEADAELREAQRLAEVGSWSWDVKAGGIRWSEELYHISGLDPAQGAPAYEDQVRMFTPESWERLDAVVRRTMQTGEPYQLDIEMIAANGSTHWIMARGEAVLGENGKVIRLRGTVARMK